MLARVMMFFFSEEVVVRACGPVGSLVPPPLFTFGEVRAKSATTKPGWQQRAFAILAVPHQTFRI